MTMVVENQNPLQYGGGGMGYENVYQGPHAAPPPSQSQFNESWPAHSSSHPPPAMYPPAAGTVKREDMPRPPPAISSAAYPNGAAVSAPPPPPIVPNGHQYSAPGYNGPELLVLPPEMPRTTFDQAQPYYAPSMHQPPPPPHHPHHHPPQHQQPPHQGQPQPPPPQQSPVHPDARSLPPGHEQPPPPTTQQPQHQPPPPPAAGPAPTHTYGDTLDASRGMVALSQELAPRNVYAQQGVRPRESYPFPPGHSSGSSMSSGHNYPYYSASVVSVDSSGTEYSSTSESYDGLHSRTLPRLSGLVAGNMPPGPQSMMGQFSSKMPSNTQKKHKCKICDKRFTRPSSLQTHMYSHTGEKPYACDVEGCGRHFSVVSNLRRHKKVHKEGKDTGSPEEEE